MSNETKGALLTILGGTCWGLSGSMGQFLFDHEGMDSRWLVPLRLGLAGIILVIYCLYKFKRFTYKPFQTKEDLRDLFIYGILGISACQFLYFTTIQYSNAGAATILQDLSPIMILAVVCISQKRRPTWKELFATVLALIGIFLITTHGEGKLMISPLALLTGILSAVCVTVYNCYPKNLLKKYPVILLQGWAFLFGGILFAFLFRIWEIHYVPALIGCFGIAFCVIVGNILAFSMYMQGVKLIGPSKAILYGFAEPLSAAIIANVWLHTPIHLGDIFGFICVFLMMVLISTNDSKQPN